MDITELATKFEGHNIEVKGLIQSTDKKLEALTAQLNEVEQRSVARRGGGGDGLETWGQQVVKQDGFKALNSQWRGRMRLEVKTTATLTSAGAGNPGDAGAMVRPDRQDGVIALVRRKLKMRDVFAPGRTLGNAIEWPRQTARSNNAGTVAEGALKAQSDMTFDLPQWPVRTIAHWIRASKLILDDAPALQSVIDTELRDDLYDVEDQQLLTGSGMGTNLLGVMTNATAFAAPTDLPSAGTLTKIDVLLQAIAQVQQAKYDPDFIGINPLDWADIQAAKDEVGNYLSAGPFATQAAILWRLPVVDTTAMTVDNFLVGAGKKGAQIFDRQDATVEISTEDQDNFVKNLITVRAEERLAFVIKYQDAFVKGTFSAALGGA